VGDTLDLTSMAGERARRETGNRPRLEGESGGRDRGGSQEGEV